MVLRIHRVTSMKWNKFYKNLVCNWLEENLWPLNKTLIRGHCLILRKPTLKSTIKSTTTNFHELFFLFNSRKYAFFIQFYGSTKVRISSCDACFLVKKKMRDLSAKLPSLKAIFFVTCIYFIIVAWSNASLCHQDGTCAPRPLGGASGRAREQRAFNARP